MKIKKQLKQGYPDYKCVIYKILIKQDEIITEIIRKRMENNPQGT